MPPPSIFLFDVRIGQTNFNITNPQSLGNGHWAMGNDGSSLSRGTWNISRFLMLPATPAVLELGDQTMLYPIPCTVKYVH
jgi:hypothetical protein